eukprot:5738571-Prymnesium_polylepis.1
MGLVVVRRIGRRPRGFLEGAGHGRAPLVAAGAPAPRRARNFAEPRDRSHGQRLDCHRQRVRRCQRHVVESRGRAHSFGSTSTPRAGAARAGAGGANTAGQAT